MGGSCFNPFIQGMELFRSFMCCGSSGRHYYTRHERIQQLEDIKKRLQQELAGIDELIEDLKKAEAKKA